MKFKVTVTQTLDVEAVDEKSAIALVKEEKPTVSVGGYGENGYYFVQSGKRVKIVSVRKVYYARPKT